MTRPTYKVKLTFSGGGVQHQPYISALYPDVTAGLDARAAAIVMQSIKNVSRNGRTVMVTIHQPSIDIFESFDALVLLQRGGKVCS